MKIRVIGENGKLVALDNDSQQAINKITEPTVLTAKKMRSYRYHKKFFQLLNIAYQYWQPVYNNDFHNKSENFVKQAGLTPEQINLFKVVYKKELKRLEPKKNFEQFRKDLTILAGFSETVYRLDNSPRVNAKSISFDKMSHEEFHKLYAKVKDVIYDIILKDISTFDRANFEDEINNF